MRTVAPPPISPLPRPRSLVPPSSKPTRTWFRRLIAVTLWLSLSLVGGASRAAEPDEASTRLAQLEAVARAALVLRENPSEHPDEAKLEDLVWWGLEGNIDVVMAEDLARLIGVPWRPQADHFRFFARWPLEAADRIRGHHSATDLVPSVELLKRLRYVFVVFESRYTGVDFWAEDPSKRSVAFVGRAVLYDLDGAKVLAHDYISAFETLGDGAPLPRDPPTTSSSPDLETQLERRLAAMVGRTSWPHFGPLMKFEPPPPKVTHRSLEIILGSIVGLAVLLTLFGLLARRRQRLKREFDGVRVQISTSDDGAWARLEVEPRLAARITWSRDSRDGDLESGDEAVDRRVAVRGAPLPALYAALTGAPVWRPIVEMGGWVEGDRERLVVELSPQIGVDANARRVAALVRDLREVGSGAERLLALSGREDTSSSTRMRIALALTREVPGSAEARAALERVGWSEPLEPHLLGCLDHPEDVLVVDVCEALASSGTEAALPPLERMRGPARPAAVRAIAAITERNGDPRRGGLELSTAEAGSLSLPEGP